MCLNLENKKIQNVFHLKVLPNFQSESIFQFSRSPWFWSFQYQYLQQHGNKHWWNENDRGEKGKTVPLQAWSGPEVSRKFRFPDFMTTAQDGGKVVSLTHRPPLPPGNTFLLEAELTPGP